MPMLSLASCLPALPGIPTAKTFAAWPVWADSARDEVKFHPMPKREAVRLWHRARAFERQTRAPGRQDGALGRNGLAVLHALIFDCLNYRTGRCDPGYARLAQLACVSIRSVARGLVALKAAGILNWIRRCAESWRDGRFTLEQQTNAYAVLPTSQWRGFIDTPPPPPPYPDTWGHHPGGDRSGMTEASAELAHGGSTAAAIRLLEADTGDELAAALARLGRAAGFGGKPQ